MDNNNNQGLYFYCNGDIPELDERIKRIVGNNNLIIGTCKNCLAEGFPNIN